MNAGWEVSEEAIAAMMETSAHLEEIVESINKEISQLKSVFEENQAGLGPHSADISSLLEDLETICDEASNPVKILVLKLSRAAVIRANILAKNGYKKSR